MLTQYCSQDILIRTVLDTDKVTGAVLSIEQDDTVLHVRTFTHPQPGMFHTVISGENMAKFNEGPARLQLRGFVGGEEFASGIKIVPIYPVILKEVLTND